jgi:hypothetical protein
MERTDNLVQNWLKIAGRALGHLGAMSSDLGCPARASYSSYRVEHNEFASRVPDCASRQQVKSQGNAILEHCLLAAPHSENNRRRA